MIKQFWKYDFAADYTSRAELQVILNPLKE